MILGTSHQITGITDRLFFRSFQLFDKRKAYAYRIRSYQWICYLITFRRNYLLPSSLFWLLLYIDFFHLLKLLKLIIKDTRLFEYLSNNPYLGFTVRLIIILKPKIEVFSFTISLTQSISNNLILQKQFSLKFLSEILYLLINFSFLRLSHSQTRLNRLYLLLFLLYKQFIWSTITIHFIFTPRFLVRISIVHLLELHQHLWSCFYIFLKFPILHILLFSISIHTIFTHLITLIHLFYYIVLLLLCCLIEKLLLVFVVEIVQFRLCFYPYLFTLACHGDIWLSLLLRYCL